MGNVIRHFMWGYQPHYRVHVTVQAESVLRKLNADLSPEVFLVGILSEANPATYPACVEPEVECWIKSEAFDGVTDLASSLRAGYAEARIMHSHPLARARADDALFRRSVRDAILQIIDRDPAKPPRMSFFASMPELVNGYLVSAVLGVATDALESQHRLSSSTVALHEYRELAVARSLIDAAIGELLAEVADGLLRPDPGLRTSDRRADEILRSAARRLASDTAFRADPGAFEGVHGFFDAICAIASLRYEQAEGHGKLVLARKDHELIGKRLAFADTIRIVEHRRARKLLELASRESALHINCESIFALVDAEVPEVAEDVFVILILGHHHWQLTHGTKVLMGVRYGEPYLPRLAGYESKLRQDLPRLFPGISDVASELLVTLVWQAEQVRHGTLLVISQEARSESDRLRGQATPIEPGDLTPELLRDLAGIDGAVLLEPGGRCFAIGVILDGLAVDQGDPSRGARFNSAVRYVQSARARGIPTLAVVVSEDGGVDFIPNLRPRVRRSILAALVNETDAIASAAQIPRSRYNRTYDSLRRMHFYLLPEDCTRLNAAIQAIELRLWEEDPQGIHIVRQEFVPDEAMEPAFYYEPE